MRRSFILFALLLILSPASQAALPTAPGLYAVFNTNRGSFTCTLFFEQTPVTVANFVGLAEGSRPWLDPETGQRRTEPFFDGLTFHRVIENFMIQGGSRNGEGTDGPGYTFPDEFVPGLVHAQAGMLSMANSGPESNGSQFFVTVAPTDWLDYKHSIFGQVIDGMEIVEATSTTATDEDDRPLDPVVIQSIDIHRVGTAAIAFDPTAAALPEIATVQPQLTQIDGQLAARFPRLENHDYVPSVSEDLQIWRRLNLPLTEEAPGVGRYDLTSVASGKEQQFYRLASVDYSGVGYGYLPDDLIGTVMQLNLSSGTTFTLSIDDERTQENAGEWLGTGRMNEDPTAPLNYLFYESNDRGRFHFILAFVEVLTDLKFSDQSGGTFTGAMWDGSTEAIRGTFSVSPQ